MTDHITIWKNLGKDKWELEDIEHDLEETQTNLKNYNDAEISVDDYTKAHTRAIRQGAPQKEIDRLLALRTDAYNKIKDINEDELIEREHYLKQLLEERQDLKQNVPDIENTMKFVKLSSLDSFNKKNPPATSKVMQMPEMIDKISKYASGVGVLGGKNTKRKYRKNTRTRTRRSSRTRTRRSRTRRTRQSRRSRSRK
jgi:hypothetical protein